MKTFKLVALDMDGTLLTGRQTISPENRKWIRAALDAGVTVMFSTGRGVQSVLPYVEELGLESPLITVNGSEVWRAPGELLSRHTLKPEWVKELYTVVRRYEDAWYWSYTVGGLRTKENWAEDYDSQQWLKFGVQMQDRARLQEIRDYLAELGRFELSNSHPNNLEINPKGVSKASGLREVCRLLGISMENVIAMGDSLNDLRMIREAGLGVAMGNAQEEVKRAADVVTVTNEEDGVARIIRQYLFDNR